MVISASQAASMYRSNAGPSLHTIDSTLKPQFQNLNTQPTQEESNFLQAVTNYARQTVESNRQAEIVATDAVLNNADVTEVVNAIAEAETNLNTLISVRDKIIAAYQEIIRMPI